MLCSALCYTSGVPIIDIVYASENIRSIVRVDACYRNIINMLLFMKIQDVVQIIKPLLGRLYYNHSL